MKTKILADFQICISAPLRSLNDVQSINFSFKWNIITASRSCCEIKKSFKRCFEIFLLLDLFNSHDSSNVYLIFHCEKYRNFTRFPGVEIFAKRHSFRILPVDSPKTKRNCAFPQNFHTRKSGEITVFSGVFLHSKHSLFSSWRYSASHYIAIVIWKWTKNVNNVISAWLLTCLATWLHLMVLSYILSGKVLQWMCGISLYHS